MSRTKSTKSTYDQVTDYIIERLENGTGPWHRPWATGGGLRNASTGRAYRGINTLLLAMAMEEGAFAHPLFLTFNQSRKLGGTVLKGSKGHKICFFKMVEKKGEPADGRSAEENSYRYPLPRIFTVFNVAQTDLDPELYAKHVPMERSVETDAELEHFLRGTGASLNFGGDRACYNPRADQITLPSVPAFENAGAYYATAFHELTHWTGHESRLDRDLGNRFGSEAYAAEELIAELGSAFLCSEFGVAGTLQHPEYIANWIQVLKNDNRAIFAASSQAQKACDLLLQSSPTASPTGEGARLDTHPHEAPVCT